MSGFVNGKVLETAWLVAVLVLNLHHAESDENITRVRSCGKNAHCSTKDVNALNCRCDQECNIYGDCCIDNARLVLHPVIKGISRLYWRCVSISKRNSTEFYKGVYAVGRCPPDSYVSSLCSRDVGPDKGYHYTLDIPVFSYNTGIYFANVFCAYCHGQYYNLRRLQVELRCTSPNITLQQVINEGVYLRGQREWLLKNHNCSMYAMEEKGVEGRECLIINSECPSGWTDSRVSSFCSAYSNVVTTTETNTATNTTTFNMYKNPYCGICNGVEPAKMGCVKPIEFRKKYPQKPPPASLSMIMDFNWNFDTCDFPYEVYDGVRGECHRLSCQYCSAKEDGTCSAGTAQLDIAKRNETCPDPLLQNASLTLKIEGYLTVGCLAVSIVCLMLHNIVFYSMPKLQNLPSSILKSLAWSLIIGQTLFLLGVKPVFDVSDTACTVIAVCIHFFLLSAFFWMNVMSIDVWNTFSHLSLKGSTKNTLRNYSLYAWGGPLVLSSLAVASDQTEMLPANLRPYFGQFPGVCWFANRIGLALFLYLPMCLLLTVNIILFTITICWLQRQTSSDVVKQASGRKECKRLWLYLKLSTIMGLSWSFGMIASLTDMPHFQYPFILFNGLQGTFIFIMFDVKRNVIEALFRHFGLIPEKNDASKKPSTDGVHQNSRSSASTSCPQSTTKI